MILIINGKPDKSTDEICKWLIFYGKKFVRIDENSVISKIELDLKANSYKIELDNRTTINFDDINAVFYKNGDFNFQIDSSESISKHFKNYHLQEWNSLSFFLKSAIKNKPIKLIGNLNCDNLNKLETLVLAQSLNLRTPETHVVSSESEIKALFRRDKKWITKSISDIMPIYRENNLFLNYTRKLNASEKYPFSFIPSLIQEEIEKKYEIRTFFINNLFWSIAIFSQESQDSSVDYRVVVSNHKTSFILPGQLKNKISRLAKKMNLNSGSVDWIYSVDNRFYFLEINPLGIFNDVSIFGGYNIEKEIAKLILQ